MLKFWYLFLAFFVPGIVGYGGGPSYIPLIQHEVVNHYHWLTMDEFGELLAMGNALPGPIATKIAGFIGYNIGGVLGAFIALFAAIAPSLIVMILLLRVIYKFKDSPRVKKMTQFIRPTIAVLLAVMAYQFFFNSWKSIGSYQTIILGSISLLLLEKFKVNPVYVILGSLTYGAFLLPLINQY